MEYKPSIAQNQLPTVWKINDWELPPGAILAPMAGVTDSPYRRIARRFGAGLLYSECVSAEGLRRRGKASFDYCNFEEDERPIAIQLFGSKPEQIEEAAAVVAELFRPDMIDLNCGCPVKKFVTRGCGGALMQYPDQIGQMVTAAKRGSGLPVSVKLRAGYWPGVETAPLAAQSAAAAGASLVAVHGRFVRKAKGTKAEWEYIARVREAVPQLPVIGNGDIFSYDDARRMIQQTGCDRVMIARWAQGRPWIFEPMRDGGYPSGPVPAPTIAEMVELILEQYRLMAERFGEKLAVLRMRKHVGWFTHGWPGGSHLRSEIMTISSLPRAIERLHAYLNNLNTNFVPESERIFTVALEDDEEAD